MSELKAGFESLPEEYQRVLRLAQERHQITLAPLQTLVGGWSGAMVFLVSVAWNETKRVEHCILKLDRKSKTARSDEVTRHNSVIETSTPEFAREHIADLVFDRVEQDGAIAIFYRIAGQSLLKYRPLSNYERQNQLKIIFTKTDAVLLEEWNAKHAFEQAVHPQTVLKKWLGFRLDAGGNIEQFLQARVNQNVGGLLINGHVFPNPLSYARKSDPWGTPRSIDVATGFIHGDLNVNNILVKFAEDHESLEGYYLIDFALFKEDMPLLYDQRYLEMSYLMHAMSQVSFAKYVDFLTRLAVADVPDPHKVPIEMTGVSEVIASARGAFAVWAQENHPSMHDDLWGQYWLAGVAAGLAYTHKAGQPDEARLAGLIYAAASLRRYAAMFKLPMPTNVELLYDETQADRESPGVSIAKRHTHNLPMQPTPFIGRAAQVAALKELIMDSDVHLITLMGPGGTGKTRLSLQVAQEVLDKFPHGVFFVPLADDTNADQLISRVAQQLEVREGDRPLLENVRDYLRDKSILLVLDNFEQLISAAPVVAELLTSAPQLKVITNSRIALQLQGEREYPVPPLDLPSSAETSLENLTGNESVTLFVERARASKPGFALTTENASAVAEICRRLDGLPLALELAAARIKLLSPQSILARLDDSLKLLTGGARDLPSRQQTLRNTLEWSHGLLNEEQKTLYARLSVFVGGFTIEAAESICNLDNQLDIIDGLTSLVNNSLLRQEEIDGEPRFSMLETIRAYALERLGESGEMDALRGKHAQYFGDVIFKEISFELYSDKATVWLDWLEREVDNIRAALTWCLSNPASIQVGVVIVWVLMWFWYRRGRLSEGRMWTERMLEVLKSQNISSQPLAMVLAAAGFMAMWQGEQDIGLARAQQSLEIVQKLEDVQLMPLIVLGNAIAYINMGRDSTARPLLKESLALFEQQNMPYFHAINTVHLGNVELGLGNAERAHAYHKEALAKARAIQDDWLLSFALNNLGEVARTQGQFDLARKYYKECEALLSTTGDDGDMARFAHSLGYIAQHEEELELAESQFRKSLSMFRRLGNRRGIAECLAGLAGLKAQQGQVEWGATLLNAAESLLKGTGGAWWPADRLEVERNREMMQSALSAAEYAKAQQIGAAMDLDQAIAFASE
jgi:predicted ATPase